MVLNFDGCLSQTKQKIIVLKENKSQLRILNENQEEIYKIRVDGCLDFPGPKCDYLLISTNSEIALYTELKGHDIKKGIIQLGNSISNIENPDNKFINGKFKDKQSYLIVFRSPLSSPEIQKEMILFRKNYGSSLLIKGPVHEIRLS